MSRVSLRSAIMAATATLDAAGVPSPGADAEELAGHLLGVPRTRLGLTPLVEPSWVDGYQAAKGEAAVGTVAFDKFGQPIGALVDDCKATPKETLWQKLKKHI